MTDDEFAATLDLARHVNDDTAELGDLLIAALIDELGPSAAQEAQQLAMACLARVIRHFDGRRVRVTSLRTAVDEVRKDEARRLFAGGMELRQVTGRTGLSAYQARKVRSELEATVFGEGPLGESSPEAEA